MRSLPFPLSRPIEATHILVNNQQLDDINNAWGSPPPLEVTVNAPLVVKDETVYFFTDLLPRSDHAPE